MTRNRNNNKNNPRPRPRQGERNTNAPATAPTLACSRISRADTQIISRRFHRSVHFPFNMTDGYNLNLTMHLTDYLNKYTQAEKMTDVYDQYRYKNITLYARSNGEGTSNVASLALVNATNATTLYGAVDLDTILQPNFGDVFNYDNMSLTSINADWKKIASYAPRIHSSETTATGGMSTIGTVLLPNSTWLNTDNRAVQQCGYIASGSMTGGTYWYSPTITGKIAYLSVHVVADIEFRGRKVKV